MVCEAARGLATTKRRFAFLVADARAIPVADGRVDAVIAHFMLHHGLDRPRAFAEIVRVLRPGGRLYAATSGRRHMREARQMAATPGLRDPAWVTPGFGLENGASQLDPWFADVELRRRRDALVVTEVEPLLRALLSSKTAQAMLERPGTNRGQRWVAELRRRLESELDERGAIRVTKDSGLFVARRGSLGPG